MDEPTLTAAQAKAAYDILVQLCGAAEHGRADFERTMIAGCREYRFMGSLGFGGKFYNDRRSVWVSCYREDETPERLSAIALTNEELAREL